MPIPGELKYEGEIREDQFIQKFLIPLLQRLGYQVVNYHGQREFGKDLVFSEVDRFSNVVYHGLQAKYEASLAQHNRRN